MNRHLYLALGELHPAYQSYFSGPVGKGRVEELLGVDTFIGRISPRRILIPHYGTLQDRDELLRSFSSLGTLANNRERQQAARHLATEIRSEKAHYDSIHVKLRDKTVLVVGGDNVSFSLLHLVIDGKTEQAVKKNIFYCQRVLRRLEEEYAIPQTPLRVARESLQKLL